MIPAIVKTSALADLLGVDPSTVWRWQFNDAAFAGCVVKRTKHSTYWSVQRLQERGFLTKPDVAAPALTFDYKVAQ